MLILKIFVSCVKCSPRRTSTGSESVILDCVERWLENHRGISNETQWEILKCVRFNQLTDQEITAFSLRVFQEIPDIKEGKKYKECNLLNSVIFVDYQYFAGLLGYDFMVSWFVAFECKSIH